MPSAAKLKGIKNANEYNAQNKREMRQIADEAHNAQVKFRPPDFVQGDDEQKKGTGREFPAHLSTVSSYDDYVERKVNAPEALGYKMLSDKDLEWMKEKEENIQFAEFENWCATYFDMKDPAIARLVEEMLPEFFKRREAVIEEVAELQKRIAYLRLHGPKSKDDLFLVYMLNNGKLKVPQGAVWDPENWYPGQKDDKNFARGLFNPHRLMGAPKVGDFAEHWAYNKPSAAPNGQGLLTSGINPQGMPPFTAFDAAFTNAAGANPPRMQWPAPRRAAPFAAAPARAP